MENETVLDFERHPLPIQVDHSPASGIKGTQEADSVVSPSHEKGVRFSGLNWDKEDEKANKRFTAQRDRRERKKQANKIQNRKKHHAQMFSEEEKEDIKNLLATLVTFSNDFAQEEVYLALQMCSFGIKERHNADQNIETLKWLHENFDKWKEDDLLMTLVGFITKQVRGADVPKKLLDDTSHKKEKRRMTPVVSLPDQGISSEVQHSNNNSANNEVLEECTR